MLSAAICHSDSPILAKHAVDGRAYESMISAITHGLDLFVSDLEKLTNSCTLGGRGYNCGLLELEFATPSIWSMLSRVVHISHSTVPSQIQREC